MQQRTQCTGSGIDVPCPQAQNSRFLSTDTLQLIACLTHDLDAREGHPCLDSLPFTLPLWFTLVGYWSARVNHFPSEHVACCQVHML
jgi:hypothetical protein